MFKKTAWYTCGFYGRKYVCSFLFVPFMHIPYVYGMDTLWKMFYYGFVYIRIMLGTITK
jgi:hypothetical protein